MTKIKSSPLTEKEEVMRLQRISEFGANSKDILNFEFEKINESIKQQIRRGYLK